MGKSHAKDHGQERLFFRKDTRPESNTFERQNHQKIFLSQ